MNIVSCRIRHREFSHTEPAEETDCVGLSFDQQTRERAFLDERHGMSYEGFSYTRSLADRVDVDAMQQ